MAVPFSANANHWWWQSCWLCFEGFGPVTPELCSHCLFFSRHHSYVPWLREKLLTHTVLLSFLLHSVSDYLWDNAIQVNQRKRTVSYQASHTHLYLHICHTEKNRQVFMFMCMLKWMNRMQSVCAKWYAVQIEKWLQVVATWKTSRFIKPSAQIWILSTAAAEGVASLRNILNIGYCQESFSGEVSSILPRKVW